MKIDVNNFSLYDFLIPVAVAVMYLFHGFEITVLIVICWILLILKRIKE